MSRAKKDPLKELDGLPAGKQNGSSFFNRQLPATQKELLAIRRAYKGGRWKKLNTLQICEWLIDRYKLDVSNETVRRWLLAKERP